MKRLFSFIISAAVLLSVLCFTGLVSPAAVQTSDIEKTQLGTTQTYYSFDAASKTLTVGGTGETPDFYNDNTSQPWYLWRSDGSIEHVIVEEGVTSLGNYFFYYVGAVDFQLPSTLVSIGNYAMSGINSAQSIVLPEGLKKIGDYAFYYSVALKSVNIPASVTSIGVSAFENCIALESVVFEDLNAEITVGKKAFLYCINLKSVTAPKRATFQSYSIGFEKTSAGSLVSGFVLNVYRDSPAYDYAVKKIINSDNYNVINEFVISSGQTVACTYYTDSCREEMIFIFTPTVSDYYKFFSSGDVDVDCSLKDADGNEICSHIDNSDDDLNFCISRFLDAGETYYFTVNCVSEMSVGDFSVSLEAVHSYVSSVNAPSLTEDGYTEYVCTYCGDSYKTDYVKRTGVRITGRVVLMETPDGSHTGNLPVVSANAAVGSDNTAVTDSDGCFELYVLPTTEKLCISAEFSVDRTFGIEYGEDMEMSLGDIALFNFDYYADGYVNAKDFAVFRRLYGEYSQEDSAAYISADCNRDGVIDYNDFKYAENFLGYGEITESIYN